MRKITYYKRFYALAIVIFNQILLFGQTQYDYYDDGVAIGGGVKVINSIIFIVILVIVLIVLLFVVGGLINLYYWFNPKAAPKYKRVLAKQDLDRKQEEYIKEQRRNASPIAVDIGLSVKWASFNLDAYKSTDVGSRFYWGENQPSIIGNPKYNKIKVNEIGDIGGDEKYDAATNILGKNWRMPTDEECQELINKCKWETKVIDGIEGRLVTGPNGKSIFLPCNQKDLAAVKYVSGHYWTSTPHHGSNSANDLRFGDKCEQPAEISCATAYCLFCIRPVYTTVSRTMSDMQKETEAKKAYAKILENNSRLSETDFNYKYYQEQCLIREEEKNPYFTTRFGGVCFVKDKIHRDEYGVIYSLDGKRLLDGNNCDCKTYMIKEGTEFVCKGAFNKAPWDFILNEKKTLEKIILPSTLLFFPISSVPEDCAIESRTPYYSIINELLIDTRKKCVVKCLNRYIQKIEIQEPIEEIEEYAFANCSVLQSVVLPKSLRRIGESAFRNCEKLYSINLPDSIDSISVSAFIYCKALHINHLPKNLSFLGNSAFQCCIIDRVTIPKCLKEIGMVPFSKTVNNITSESSRFIIVKSLLIDVETSELIQLVNSEVKQVSIPECISKIRASAFINTNIESVTIPSTVKELGERLFGNCKKLAKVQINCEIERLPDSCFASCSSLTSFIVPKCIKVIELGAFYGCTNLLEIYLNNGLQFIKNRAFEGCTNLVSLNIPESVKKIGDNYESCFKDCMNLKELFYDAREAEITDLPHSITNLIVGPHVKKLPKFFLNNNSVLEVLDIPNNVQQIEKGCIADCSNLKRISIASKNITLEEGWIRNCENLRTISIHVNAYEQILSKIPQELKIKVEKIKG